MQRTSQNGSKSYIECALAGIAAMTAAPATGLLTPQAQAQQRVESETVYLINRNAEDTPSLFPPIINDAGEIALAELNATPSSLQVNSATSLFLFDGALRTLARPTQRPDNGFTQPPPPPSFVGIDATTYNLNNAGEIIYAQYGEPNSFSVPDRIFRSSISLETTVVDRFEDIDPSTRFIGTRTFGFADSGALAGTAELFSLISPFPTKTGLIAGRENLQVVVFPGRTPAPGILNATFSHIQSGASYINAIGNIAFAATAVRAANQPPLPNPVHGIWSGAPESLQIVHQTGDPAPGFPSTGNTSTGFSGFEAPAQNASGHLVFKATAWVKVLEGIYAASPGIWHNANGQTVLVTATGRPTPTNDNATFTQLRSPVINANGDIAFRATDNMNREGIYLFTNGSLTTISRQGMNSPLEGGFDFISFSDPTINANKDMVFTATDSIGLATLWFRSGNTGDLIPIAREGDSIQTGGPITGAQRTISTNSIMPDTFNPIRGAIAGPSGLEDGRQAPLNEAGILTYKLEFTDGSTGVFVTDASPPDQATQDCRLIDIAPDGGNGQIDVFDLIRFLQGFSNQDACDQ